MNIMQILVDDDKKKWKSQDRNVDCVCVCVGESWITVGLL